MPDEFREFKQVSSPMSAPAFEQSDAANLAQAIPGDKETDTFESTRPRQAKSARGTMKDRSAQAHWSALNVRLREIPGVGEILDSFGVDLEYSLPKEFHDELPPDDDGPSTGGVGVSDPGAGAVLEEPAGETHSERRWDDVGAARSGDSPLPSPEFRLASVRLSAQARKLPLDHAKRYEFLWNVARPKLVELERFDEGTPVERVDLAIATVTPFLVVFPCSRARFVCCLRATIERHLRERDDLDSHLTVGALGDLVDKANVLDFLTSVALYGEVLLRSVSGFRGEPTDDTEARRWMMLCQHTLNNIAAGTMSYLQFSMAEEGRPGISQQSADTIIEKAGRMFRMGVILGLRDADVDPKREARRSMRRLGLIDEGGDGDRGDDPDRRDASLLVALDRRCMAPSLAGAGRGTADAAYFQLAATAARAEIPRIDRLAGGLFNAGVELLRFDATGEGRRPHRNSRMLCNAVGVLAALWSSRGDVGLALAKFDGDDCLVNLAGSVAQYARESGAREEIMRIVAHLASESLQYRQYMEPLDAARIEASISTLPTQSDSGESIAFGDAVEQLIKMIAEEMGFSVSRPLSPDKIDPLQWGDFLAEVACVILRAIVESDSFSRAPISDEQSEAEYARVRSFTRTQVEEDWERSGRLQTELRSFAADLEQWLGGGHEADRRLPRFVADADYAGFDPAWRRVCEWLSNPRPTVEEAFHSLDESITQARQDAARD